MLLAPPNTVLLLANLINFIHRTTLSAGSDLRTILVLYDNPSTQLANEILCSSRLQSIDVSWCILNGDVWVPNHYLDDVLPLTVAILQHELKDTISRVLKHPYNPLNTNNIILIYPFEITDTIIAEFEHIAEPIFLVNFVDDKIKVIFRSRLFDRTIILNESQFENNIQNWFYRPFENMESQSIDVVLYQEPPISFTTVSTQEISGQQSERLNGVGGADLNLVQLIAECLHGTAVFHVKMEAELTEMPWLPKEFNDYIINKQRVPLKAPALPPIKNLDYLSEKEFFRKFVEYERKLILSRAQMYPSSSYPHTEMEYVIVLPNIVLVRSIVISLIVRNPLFSVWALIVTLITVIRKLLQRSEVMVTRRSFSDLFFDSWSRAFGTSIIAKESSIRAERILLISLSFVAVLAGIFCSGSLIEKFTTNQYTPSIRNFDDLKTSDYTLMVPYDFNYNTLHYFRENFKNDSVKIVDDIDMYSYIWSEKHPHKYFAYVIPENACLWLGLYSAEGRKRYYILQPSFCIKFSVHFNVWGKHFQEAIELILKRAVEHGFVAHFERSCRNALVQEFANIDDSSTNDTSYTQGTIADLYFILSCIGIGVSISCVILAGELLFNKYHSKLPQPPIVSIKC